MLGDMKLSELCDAHDGLRRDLASINESLEGCEDAIKREIISIGATEVLNVNWPKLRRMVAHEEARPRTRSKSS